MPTPVRRSIPDPTKEEKVSSKASPPRPVWRGLGRMKDGELDAFINESIERAIGELQSPSGSRDKAERAPEEARNFVRFLNLLGNESDRPGFPLQVFPPLIRRYITSCSSSIHCTPDLVAVPLLAVAGAATGRSGRKLKVKDGWSVTSCLWTVCVTDSSGGKTPALNAAQNFYEDRQQAEDIAYQEAKAAHAKNPKENEHPGPYPSLKLSDTTIESLRVDLTQGPVLFARDELGGWCHQMGQYKGGAGGEKYDWCSIWSHSAINIGRKTERVYVREPFVGVTGMMVPASVRELNYRGNADDGFVHRILAAAPASMRPKVTERGVPESLTAEYKRRMSRLFEPPKGDNTLTFELKAFRDAQRWANDVLYRELSDNSPGWLVSKYRKLFENCLRLSLVLHEIWRAAGCDPEDDFDYRYRVDPDTNKLNREFYGEWIGFRPKVVDRVSVEQAIAVVEYFKNHIGAMQSLMGEDVDDVDRLYTSLAQKGTVTVRQVIHKSSFKRKDQVLAIFAEWGRRGYGTVEHPRKNQTQFRFSE